MIKPRELESGKGRDLWDTMTAATAGDTPALHRLLESDPSLGRAEYFYSGFARAFRPMSLSFRDPYLFQWFTSPRW